MIDFSNLHLYRENNRIEAKQAQGGLPHSIWETYSAFANTLGGMILLGVMETEDKTFRSVPLGNADWLAEEFWRQLTDGSHVNINILTRSDVHIVESEGNPIVVIEVPKADRNHRPIYIGSDPFSGSYCRDGEGDYRCTPEQVRLMLRERTAPGRDKQLLMELSLDELNTDSIIRYHANFSALHPFHPMIRLDLPDFLRELGAAGSEPLDTEKIHPTLGGLLMFGHYADICRYFPGFSLNYDGHHSQASLYDFYCHVCENLFHRLPSVSDDTLLRQAVCEAIANALIHADYQSISGTGLEIMETDDTLEITNPGNFRINIKEALSGHISDPRNASLSTMFGMILPRSDGKRGLSSVLSAWKSQGWAAPHIHETFFPDRTTLILPLTSSSAKDETSSLRSALGSIPLSQSLREQQIARILTDHPVCTLEELSSHLGLSKGWVRRLLGKMLDKDLITADRNAPGHKTRYRLKV